MQRNLASICFLVAAIALGLAAGAWWLQFTVLTPDDSVGKTHAILGDDEIRADLTTVVVAATAGALDETPGEIAALVDPLLASRAGAAVVTDIISHAHARVIGERDDPVRITGEQMVQIVRDQAAADVPAVTLPVAEITTLRALSNLLGWFALVAAVIGVLIGVFGIVTRPERGESVRGLGELLVSLGVFIPLIGVIVPVFVLPTVDDTVWIGMAPRLAMRPFPLVAGVSVVLLALGLLLILRSVGSSRKKQWSTPLSVGRYREERRWS